MPDIESLLQRFSKSMAKSGMGRSARLQTASRLEPTRRPERTWSLSGLAGKTALLTGPARLSAALLLVHQAQLRRTVPLWIAAAQSTFFPPDAARMGIDLAALPLVLLSEESHQRLLWRILQRSLASEAFSLVILDGLLPDMRRADRLARAAAEHGTALLLLAPPAHGRPRGGLGKVPILTTRRLRMDASSFLIQISNLNPNPRKVPQAGIRFAALPELTLFH